MLGASGYTGSELVRMLLRHPRAEIALLTAERSAGKARRVIDKTSGPPGVSKPMASICFGNVMGRQSYICAP